MILFFFGHNDYLLKQKLRELKEKYKVASKGSFDLVTLEGGGLTFEKFLSQVQTVALFTATRLIIIEQVFNAPKETQEKIKNFLPEISQSSVVVFVHVGEPDKRTALFKALNKPKVSEHFEEFERSSLPAFVRREAKKRGANFANDAMSLLIETVGSNPWQLSNEIEKLATYRAGGQIEKGDIEELVSVNIFANVFSLIDALVDNNKKKAFRELDMIISVNEPPLKVLGAINFQFRLIAEVKDELERGTPNGLLAKKLKVNPYPLRKAVPYASRFSWEKLSRYYRLMSELDENIKTGKIVPEEALKDLLLKA